MTSAELRSVLCYGDSNTWGYRAATDGRFGRWERWPGVLQRELGDAYHVVEEALGGRTTMFDVPGERDRNGLAPLPMLLESHAPLDAIVVALGINDIFVPGVTAVWAARGVETLITTIRGADAGPEGRPPALLVIAPPPLGPLSAADEGMAPDASAQSLRLADAYRAVCEPLGADVLDLTDVCEPTPEDGVHFELEAHRAIGLAVTERLRRLLGTTA